MSDIFICYSRKDRAVADRLLDRLRAESWSVWMDTRLETGTKWRKEIQDQLAAARCVVVLWSAAAEQSDYVMDEAEDARKRGILVPALIESMPLPYGFRQVQTTSLVGWTGQDHHDGLHDLLGAVRGRLSETGVYQPSGGILLPFQLARVRQCSPGETFRDKLKTGGEGPLMVVIPAGRFLMGSPSDELHRWDEEGPQHWVQIAKPVAIGVYVVTFDEYDCFCDSVRRENPSDQMWGRGKRPAINVSWDDAQAYCAWLSEQTGRPYRLPSEAEWEYACRAGTTTPFHFGPRITTDQANFDGKYTYNGSPKGESRGKTTPVGSFPPNAFGLYDMHGNVLEWCQDTLHVGYNGAPQDGSPWEEDNEERVVRGGYWGTIPENCRAAFRDDFEPASRRDLIGFRVCCSSPIG